VLVEQARAEYFARNGFSTAAYDERWVHLKIGPIPIAFPNVESRRLAIPYHDIHHVVTGYSTTPAGEAEIGAWEIAACLGDRGRMYAAAWVLNSTAFAAGLVIAPRRTYRAFVRGRRCTSAYRSNLTEALAMDVGALQHRLGLDAPVVPRWRDRLAFVAFVGLLALPPAAVLALALTRW
jgi:hypothetical protein